MEELQNTSQFIIDGDLISPPPEIHLTNFLHPSVPSFRARQRGRIPVTELIIHETVTTSVETTIKVLQRRKLGVHFIVGPNGHVTQHNDLLRDRLGHAKPHNKRSIGIEVVTPYYPKYLKPEHPWKKIIDAGWAHKKRYVVPTPEQAETTALLIEWLTSDAAIGLQIPRRWISLRKGRFAMGRVWKALLPKPGIYPHTAFGHADGAWLALYSWLRLEGGYAPEAAYAKAVHLATGTQRRLNMTRV